MNRKNRILEYLRLPRIQTAAVTAVTPIVGSLVMGQQDIVHLLVLFLIGFLYHIYGFVLNEYVDVEVDRKSRDLQKKPLISNIIPKGYALFISLLSGACSCLLTLYFFPSVLPLLFLLFAILLGGIYDVYGKKIPGSDFILGLGFFFMCLMGASTVSHEFTTVTYIVCCIYFVHIVFNNAVEGGLKDVDHDTIGSAKTLATRMGVTVQNNRLKVTKTFAVFSISIKIIFIGLIVSLWLQPEIRGSLSYNHAIQITLIVFFASAIAFTMYKFLHSSTFDRPRLKRLFSVHEISSYFILILSLYSLIGVSSTIFLIFFPFIWFILFNVILYGKLLQPQV
ncbi:MAG TPA: UbiA family prenyltransferase [Candidatus Thermoplasmatota archaeon]|nr:UbiA family prenyltransferase [Candidatus Thermoplasmatota archaeon]